jgi:hypothetical protein
MTMIQSCEVQSELPVHDSILLTKEQTRNRFDTSIQKSEIQNSEAHVPDDLGGSPWIQIPIESPASRLVARGMNRRRGARNYSRTKGIYRNTKETFDERRTDAPGIERLVRTERDRDPAIEQHRPAVVPEPRSGSINPGSRDRPSTPFPATMGRPAAALL